MSAPRISVVIPGFNAEGTIESAVASALDQCLDDVEIVVVDDGSTDRTPDAARASGSSRLRVVRHDQNLGAAAARNSGIGASRGKLVAFLDADDRWHAHKLRTQVGLLASHAEPEVTGSVHSVIIERPDGQSSVHAIPEDLDLRRDLMWGCRLSPGSTLIVTRACLERVGPFDARLRRLEDWDWLLRFATRYRLAVCTTPLAWVRRSARGSREEICSALELLREKYAGFIAGLDRVERRKIESTFLIERAGAAYGNGRVARAILLTSRALLRYPFRDARFYRRMMQITFECLSDGGGEVAIPPAGVSHVAPSRHDVGREAVGRDHTK